MGNARENIDENIKENKKSHVIKTGVAILPEIVLQAVYPRRCPVCDDIVGRRGEKICLKCMDRLKLLTPPWCMRCGKKTEEGQEYCGDCREKAHLFERGRALYEYDSAAEPIYRFKYGGRREYAEFFGEQLADYLGDYIRGLQPDGFVPIPLHRRRRAVRGYNQAELLADAVGRRMGIPVYSHLLVRTRNTTPQKKLNREERQNNLKRAFNIPKNDVKLKTILVFDDIYTTGATIDEAARALRAAGAERVYFVTLACGAGV
ncbi:MAG: ComF family protein [Butyrivibrio sp.]|nr:ComF family protein [Acetatifactor muris]MCM1559205.1 ComF family protein [Butyrivibrio sp.]